MVGMVCCVLLELLELLEALKSLEPLGSCDGRVILALMVWE